MLIDNHGRPLDYLRLAVTDRCNLRCFYCMPEQGIDYVHRSDLLSYEEMLELIEVLAGMGIRKVRLTGGEPFVRRGLMEFLHKVTAIPGIQKLYLTTNGTLTAPHIPELKAMGIAGINLSLDTLDPKRFFEITRRDRFREVMATFEALVESGIPTKINMVVMEGRNTEDIIPMAELTRRWPVAVRYIEEMPFNGTDRIPHLNWNHTRILETLKSAYPFIEPVKAEANSTSSNYKLPGTPGELGIIAAFSRSFCGTCNRIRITPQGGLKTCLYGSDALNLRDILRSGKGHDELKSALLKAFGNRAKDGFEAELKRDGKHLSSGASMSTIGG